MGVKGKEGRGTPTKRMGETTKERVQRSVGQRGSEKVEGEKSPNLHD